MSKKRLMLILGSALMVLVLLAPAALAQDEEPRLNLQFQGETLGQILQLLSRGYGLQYTLGEGVDPNTRITTSLVGVTVDQALRAMLEPNGLIAVNQDGRYIIRERPQPTEREGTTAPLTPVAATGSRPTPPAPTRPTSYTPGAATPAEGDEEEEEEEPRILEVIWPKYIGAAMASAIFGGGIIDAGAGIAGGGYGGSSYRGGYGGSSYGGGYGSSYGGGYGSSSFGRSSSFGSRSSSFGSRSSSFGSRSSGIGY